ncbi:probable cytokinin riboside 5'-monophosphate phosphoribohydrolase LOGL10 [Diospyros lotus]|uniref:probable cytokinin riboside 5'-monophosphate phosphoribohydrolase LOGL10 n=1 Tax=Diospyros lotus TaxID=55363 RepID=UPI00224D928C|nr:probable cytokinin riboside 5'-monophosphate phosphoribohydrolase LOGL10 [Diospyros lotus]
MEGQFVRQIKTICVLCGSQLGSDICYALAANELGKKLGEKKINLVYGGGSRGLNGYVSQAVHLGNSSVVGIMPIPLAEPHISGITRGQLIETTSMSERMACKIYQSDAFIALPGGFGTLEEIFCIISWAKSNLHTKPIGLLNVNHFFDGLLSFLDQAVDQQFISRSARKILISASTIDKLLEKLHAYVPQYDPHEPRIDWSKAISNKRPRGPINLDLSL